MGNKPTFLTGALMILFASYLVGMNVGVWAGAVTLDVVGALYFAIWNSPCQKKGDE
jgi:hypothetical protein